MLTCYFSNNEPFSVLCEILSFFMIKPVCRTLPIYSYMCIFTACVIRTHKYHATSLFGFFEFQVFEVLSFESIVKILST